MYVAINIRSNILYTICLFNKFCSNFDFQRLFKYIQNIFRYDIEYAFDEQNFHEFIDAN